MWILTGEYYISENLKYYEILYNCLGWGKGRENSHCIVTISAKENLVV